MHRQHSHCHVLLLLTFCLLHFIGCQAWSHSALAVRSQKKTLLTQLRKNVIVAAASSSGSADVTVTGDDAASSTSGVDVITKSVPKVRREYETFLWTPQRQQKSQPATTYKINYRVEGPPGGRPILLVHGFGANINHYRFQFPDLAEAGYRVFGIDLLGFGASDKPTDTNVGYTFDLFSDLLVDFVDYIDQQNPVQASGSSSEVLYRRHDWCVAGNSIGGLLSLAVAERLPERVGGVVLFNCSGGLSAFRYSDFSNNPLILLVLWIVQQLLKYTPYGGNFFRDFKTRENVESILRKQGVYGDDENVNDELLEILLEPSNDEGAQHVFLQVFGGEPGPTPESILPNIQCPILALWGEADPWTPIDNGMHPGSKFGQYTKAPYHLVRLPGAGHCPHDEVPKVCNAKMIQWMKDELLPTTIEARVA